MKMSSGKENNRAGLSGSVKAAVVLALTFVLLSFVPTRAYAATYTVCASGCDNTSIIAMMNAASEGDTINVSPGTYSEFIYFVKNLTVQSTGSAADTFLTGSGSNSPVVQFNSSVINSSSLLKGFTINNSANSGSSARGIYIGSNATPTIQDCVVKGNTPTTYVQGAGIQVTGGTSGVTMSGMTVGDATTKNVNETYGANFNAASTTGQITISNSSFIYGSGTNGSGIALNDVPNVTLTNITVENNTATQNGAGIYLRSGSVMTFTGGSISNNSSTLDGGAIYTRGSGDSFTITGSTTITGNSGRVGGAIYTWLSNGFSITDAIIDNNDSTSHGGAIYWTSATGVYTLTNTSIDDNTAASGSGGGLYMDTSSTATITLTNVTVDNNTVSNTSSYDGGGIYVNGTNITLNITGGSISGNSARGGGGIYSIDGVDTVIIGASINNNNATTGYGGGIYSSTSGASLTISKSFIQGNSVRGYGGGIFAGSGTTNTITNTVITGNRQHTTSWRYGGGIYNSGTLYMYNSTIAGNYAFDGGGISANGIETIVNSIIYGNTAGNGSNHNVRSTIGTSTNNNIGTNARFVDLQQASSGAATTAGDYRLCYGTGNPAAGCGSTISPDLDMGNQTNAPSDDILGTARPEDISGVGDGSFDYDRGAYEYFTPDLTPPANVTGFSVTDAATSGQLNLTWTNPSDIDFTGVKIVRATGGTAPSDCTGTAVYDGSATSYNNTGLVNGTQYSYRICSYDAEPNYASGVTDSGTPTDTVPPSNVTGLAVNELDTQIDLSWTNPLDADYAGTRVLRKTGGYPSSCTDGTATTVYNSTGTSHPDTGLVNGTTYYYRVCAYDTAINYPSGVTINGTPFVDVTAPAAIADLVASLGATNTSLDLDWTAPGDDGGTGTATSYDVRYSTSTITEGNWSGATQATGEPAPSVATSAENMTVTGLTCDTQYYFAVKTMDEASNTSLISNIPSTNTFSCSLGGMLTYGDSSAGTVKHRAYTDGSGFAAEAATNAYAGATTYVNVVEAPTRDEYMLVSTYDSQPMYVQRYDGSNWSSEWNSGVSISGSSRNFFNVAYEQNSGDALVVYEQDASANASIAYRTFDGSSWSAEQVLGYLTLPGASTAVITRVHLISKKYSDEVLLVMMDSGARVYGFIWNGTEFVNGKTIAYSGGTGSSTNDVISGAWEGSSGEAMVAYGNNGGGISYATYDGSAWSSTMVAFDLNGSSNFAPHVDMDGDRTSDNIALIASVTSANTAEARIWTGSAWEASPPTPGNKGTAGLAGVSVAWERTGGKALFAWTNASTTSNNVSYMTYTTGGTGWSTTNMNTTNMTGDWGSYVNYLELYADSNTFSSNIMMVGVDGGSEGRAILWNGTSWITPNNYLYDTNTSNNYTETAAFAWDILTSAPANITGAGVVANAEGSRLDLSWTNPVDPDFAGVKIVRAVGATAPADCTGTAVYDGAATGFSNTLLTDGTQYSYRLCAYDSGGNYASGLTGSGTPADTTPPANVTGFTAVAASTKVLLSWTNPTDGDYVATRILRKTGGYPSSCTDGTATTAYNGAGISYTDTGLVNGTTYYYRACPYDEVPLYPSGATATENPNLDITPPGEATGFTVNNPASGGQLNLSWTNPGDVDFTGVKIFRAEGATPPADCLGSGAIYLGSSEAYNDTPVTDSQQYSYRLCTYDLSDNTSTGVTGSGTSTDTAAPANVGSFAAVLGDTQVTLTWTNPSDSDFTGTKILQKTSGYPSSCTDGTATTVYDGTALTFVDTGLTNGVPYYYMACPHDATPNYPLGVTATATPDGTDVTAPERIDDLAISTYTVTTVNLTFTAPGDDDATGTASGYDIRYSDTLGISSTTWASSTQMTGEPVPNVAGTGESIELTGLICGTAYSIAMKAVDEMPNTSPLSNVLVVTTTACDAQQDSGMAVYGVSVTSSVPKVRTYAPLTGFASEASANNNSGTLRLSVIREAPTRDEYMIATIHASNYIYVQRYDGSSWSTEWNSGVSVSGSNRNYFDVEYEQQSGDALVVYEQVNGSNKTVAFRTYDGSTWSGEQLLDYSGLAGSANSAITRLKMYAKKGSNEILLVMMDSAREVYAYIWNGTGFINGKTITINRNTASNIDEVIGGAWESLSGEAFIAFGDSSSAVSYSTYNGSTWSTDAQAYDISGSFNAVEHIDLAADPTSDYIAVIDGSTSNRVDVRMWTGSAWEASPPSYGTKSGGLPSVSVAWLGQGGKALFVWGNGSQTNNNIDYITYTTGSGWSLSNMTAAPSTGAWSGTVYYVELFTNRASYANQIMLVGLDSWSDAKALVWTDGTWSTPANTVFTAGSTTNYSESIAFDWDYNITPFTDASGFAVTAFNQGDRIDLSWTNPVDADFAYVKVMRVTGGTAPANCASGTNVYIGTNTSYEDSDVVNGTQYSYRTCAYSTSTLASVGVTGSATPGDTLAPADVTGFLVVPGNTQVALSWTNPTDSDYVATKVLRKAGSSPSSCTDGTATTVYDSTGTSHDDATVINGTTYYYLACPYDGVPNYPTGVASSATPNPDFTAPSAVVDMATAGSTVKTMALTWTAPGDDGSSGTATSYDVRYSTSTITEGNWGAASAATGEPSPSVAGSSESMTVTALNCGTEYFFAIKALDEYLNAAPISNIVSQATSACAGDGMLVYGDETDGVVKYRSFTNAGGLSAEASANTYTALTYYSNVVEAPTRDEYIMVSTHADQPMHVQRYDGSSWSSEWSSTEDVFGSYRNYFNVAYEHNSGDALVVYENTETLNQTIAYRTYDGSTWSSEQFLDYSSLADSADLFIARVNLYQKKGSDEILLVMLDPGKEVYAYIWNGTSFVNGKTITVNRNLIFFWQFDVAVGGWEGISGDAMVAFGDASKALSYATFDGTTWTDDAEAFDLDGVTGSPSHVALDGDSSSDYLAVIVGTNSDAKVDARVWTGSAWEAGAPVAGSQLGTLGWVTVAVAWEGTGGRALFAWNNVGTVSNNISYMTYTTGGVGWSTSDMNSTTMVGDWTASMGYLDLFADKRNTSSHIMLLGQDAATPSDGRAFLWDGSDWSTPTNYLYDQNISVYTREVSAFAWEVPSDAYYNVTGFGVTAYPDGNRIDLSWTNPTDLDFAGVKIVKATGTTAPVDCTGTAIYTGLGTAFSDTGLTNGTQYSYRICAFDNGSSYASGLIGSATAADTQAPLDVTSFTVVAANTQASLSWVNPTETDYVATKVLRKTGTYPSSCTDGTATTVYDGAGTSYNDTSLVNGTTYYYRACPYDEAPNYPTGVTGTAIPFADVSAPADVTSFTVSNLGLGNQLSLSWTNPSDTDFAAVKIVRATGGSAPSDCTGSAVYDGSLAAYTDTSLTDGAVYSYRICSYDYSYNYASGVTDNATPTDTLAPSSITGFTPTPGDTDVTFNWVNPVETDFAGTKVLRKTGTYPSSCTDGTATTAYNSTGATFVDTGLIDATTYYYIACAYDEVPNYATSVAATVTLSRDTTSPAKIVDLSSVAVYTRGIKLSWTAPGDDDGTGTASTYDLRYTDAQDFVSEMKTYLDIDWGNLDQVDGEPAPQTAGSTETHFFGKNKENVKLLPNTSYFNVIKSKDDLDNPSVISNEVSVHTALKYGYNYMSLPFDASTGMSATLQNLLGDDVPYVYIFKWTPLGLDWGNRFRGRWTRLSSSSFITSAFSNGSGYYMYVYSANFSVIDEQDSGGTPVVSENTDSWAKVDMVQGRNLVGNPYTKNVDFSTIKVCQNSTFTTSGGCSGGTVMTFVEAVTAGWMDSTVAYYGNATTFTTETCSSIECVAKLRPWWGQWVYLLQSSDTYIMAVPKP